MYNVCQPICRYDGIGRRDGLKIRWWQHRVGSSPTTGTSSSQASYRLRRVFHFIAKLIARLFCCSSLPNRTRCRWAPVWGRRFAAVLSILRSKVRFALASFYAQGKKDIIRPLPYFPFPTATRCAGPAVGRQPSGVAFHAPSPNPLDGGFINNLEGRSGRMSSPALEAVSAWDEVERPGRRAGAEPAVPNGGFGSGSTLLQDQLQPRLHGVQLFFYIAYNVRAHNVSLAVYDIGGGIGGNIRDERLVKIPI